MRVALVSKTWSSLALDVLWQDIGSLRDLFTPIIRRDVCIDHMRDQSYIGLPVLSDSPLRNSIILPPCWTGRLSIRTVGEYACSVISALVTTCWTRKYGK